MTSDADAPRYGVVRDRHPPQRRSARRLHIDFKRVSEIGRFHVLAVSPAQDAVAIDVPWHPYDTGGQPRTPRYVVARSPVGNLYVYRGDHGSHGRPPAVRRQLLRDRDRAGGRATSCGLSSAGGHRKHRAARVADVSPSCEARASSAACAPEHGCLPTCRTRASHVETLARTARYRRSGRWRSWHRPA